MSMATCSFIPTGISQMRQSTVDKYWTSTVVAGNSPTQELSIMTLQVETVAQAWLFRPIPDTCMFRAMTPYISSIWALPTLIIHGWPWHSMMECLTSRLWKALVSIPCSDEGCLNLSTLRCTGAIVNWRDPWLPAPSHRTRRFATSWLFLSGF